MILKSGRVQEGKKIVMESIRYGICNKINHAKQGKAPTDHQCLAEAEDSKNSDTNLEM
jgi:hypothetical protein